MTDQEVALIRRHAETMACIVVESNRVVGLRLEVVPRRRYLPEPVNGSALPTMVGAAIYVRVSTKTSLPFGCTSRFGSPGQVKVAAPTPPREDEGASHWPA